MGWAPLPPEAEVSRDGSISSWSDSRYDIGPAAYAFIRFSRWHEPSYARYVEPPERNIQIINQTRNVTNIVTNNNVINNFGPPVQTVATRTNRNIQQVNLALTPVTGPRANFGQTLRGNQLTVVTPTATLKPQATHAPPVQNQIANPRIHRGWQGVKPQEAAKLRRTIAEQNPPPKDQPKPTPFVKPQIGNRGQTTGPASATPGTPSAMAGPKTPPGLGSLASLRPSASVIPSAPPKAATFGKKPLPPNLLGPKASGGAPLGGTFRDFWRSAKTRRKTDYSGPTGTQAAPKRKRARANCAQRDSSESDGSKTLDDSGPFGITKAPRGWRSDTQANR